MTRKELQDALRAYREQGLTDIKLNLSNERLYAEYLAISSELEIAQESESEAQTAEQPLVDSESISWFERYLFEVGLKMIGERWLEFIDPRLKEYAVNWVPGEPGMVAVSHEFFGDIFMVYIYGPQLPMTLSSLRNFVTDFEKEAENVRDRHNRSQLEKLLNMPA